MGAVRCTYTPGYSGAPANVQTIWSINKAIGDNANLIEIKHSTNGNFYFDIFNSAGAADEVSFVWSPVAGTSYEIEVNIDITTGNSRVFIDGVLMVTSIYVAARDTNINLLNIGCDYTLNSSGNNFSISKFYVFSAVQHTAAYTPGSPITFVQYSQANPTIVENIGLSIDSLDAFIEVSSKTGSDEIKYILLIDGVATYWDGLAWSASDGTYSNSNTAAEIQANLATLDVSSGVTLKVLSLLHSNDGSTTPTLTSVSIDYNFFVVEPADPLQCIVYTWLKDLIDGIISGAKLTVELKKGYYYGEHYVGPNKMTVDFNASGYAEIPVIEGATHAQKYDITISYKDAANRSQTIVFEDLDVPNLTSVTLASIV